MSTLGVRDYPKVRPGRCELHNAVLYEAGDGYRCWPCEDQRIHDKVKASEGAETLLPRSVEVALRKVEEQTADYNDAMVLAAEVHSLRLRIGQSLALLRAALDGGYLEQDGRPR